MQAGKLLRPLLSGEQSARNTQSHAETCSLLCPPSLPPSLHHCTGNNDGNDWRTSKQHLTAPSNWKSYFLPDFRRKSSRCLFRVSQEQVGFGRAALLFLLAKLHRFPLFLPLHLLSRSVERSQSAGPAPMTAPNESNTQNKLLLFGETPTFAVLGLHDDLSSPLSFPSLTKQLLPKSLLGQNSTLLLKRVLSFQSASSFTSIFQSKVVEEHKFIVRLADGSWSYYGNSSNPSFYHLSLYYWPIKWYLLTQELEGPAAKLPLSNQL